MKLEEVLRKCIICLKRDPLNSNTCMYVECEGAGELLAADILDMGQNEKVLVVIDYFSRKIWARMIKTKEAIGVLKFLKEVHRETKFKRLQTDNGREFCNRMVKDWTAEQKIQHKLTTPYYHKGNGRVERANRTIREALSKTVGKVRRKLPEVIRNYNNSKHRGIGMSPNEAWKSENQAQVKANEQRYKKEFERKNRRNMKLTVGDKVLLRNEKRTEKNQDRFDTQGVVRRNEYGDVYKVETENGGQCKRHISQLKKVEEREVVLVEDPGTNQDKVDTKGLDDWTDKEVMKKGDSFKGI